MQLVQLVACSVASNPCPNNKQILVNAYVTTDSTQAAFIDSLIAANTFFSNLIANSTIVDNLINGSGSSGNVITGVDWSVVLTTFECGLFIYCLGLGLGLVINAVKKAR